MPRLWACAADTCDPICAWHEERDGGTPPDTCPRAVLAELDGREPPTPIWVLIGGRDA